MTRFYRCHVCRFAGDLEPSPPLNDASCPNCGTLLYPGGRAPGGSGDADDRPTASGRTQIVWIIGIIVVIGAVVFWRNRAPTPADLPGMVGQMLNDPNFKAKMEEARKRAEAHTAMYKAFSHPRRLHSLAEYTDLPDASAEGAYIKGKVVVLFRPSAGPKEDRQAARWFLAGMNQLLPEGLQAMSPEEVGTVVLIREKREGKCLAEVRVIDRTRPALVGTKTFTEEEKGAPPPEPASSDGDLLSSEEISKYLLALPRRQ